MLIRSINVHLPAPKLAKLSFLLYQQIEMKELMKCYFKAIGSPNIVIGVTYRTDGWD
jgi:hypothetical protein